MATLSNNLKRRAIYWAGELTKNAKGYAPTHLKEYIHTKVEDTPDGFLLRLGVQNKAPTGEGHYNYGSSDARAQEYGSGERAQRRVGVGLISIDPHWKPILIFPGTHEWEGITISTYHVDHPGIKATNDEEGYLRPAVKDLRARMKQDLTEDVRDAIRTTMRMAFKGYE